MAERAKGGKKEAAEMRRQEKKREQRAIEA